jgi:small basic protein
MIVLGYEGEPYLRVGPDGAYRNSRSPSTYRNASRTDTNRIPDSADANADPEWERIGDCCTVRWHDHRAHYMGSSDPPAVQAQPDVARTIIETWTVDVRLDDGSTVTVTGDVEWVPAPSAVPWIVLILLIVGLVAGLSFTRWWPKVLGVALAIAILTEIVHVVGNWTGVEASFGSKFGTAVFAIAAIALGIAALVHLIVRGGVDAAPSVLVAAVALGITGGFADIEAFARSQLPFAFGADFGRATVAVTLGLSIGLVIGAGMHLRRPAPTPPAPAPLAAVPTP